MNALCLRITYDVLIQTDVVIQRRGGMNHADRRSAA